MQSIYTFRYLNDAGSHIRIDTRECYNDALAETVAARDRPGDCAIAEIWRDNVLISKNGMLPLV